MSAFIEILESGSYDIQVGRQHFNKGDKSRGFIQIDDTADYITMDYINSLGHDTMMSFKGDICIKLTKSENDQTKIIKTP